MPCFLVDAPAALNDIEDVPPVLKTQSIFHYFEPVKGSARHPITIDFDAEDE